MRRKGRGAGAAEGKGGGGGLTKGACNNRHASTQDAAGQSSISSLLQSRDQCYAYKVGAGRPDQGRMRCKDNEQDEPSRYGKEEFQPEVKISIMPACTH